ncbi:hypothetical protein ASG43_18710 [Aureimonas sp. Leaf454]|uniref:PRC-barrel domain-containing protein n=1 Tax=Aureimonas sp. Leaf454 TaxID=1736381 RepID=UPI0006FEF635|nr:PRC-barrel domain-containing protein [Aureimonas sp. Leaf454]KQT53254.1 hypothetical protein ASG43_18710 [Aureimonas sp. Leaf454]
MTNRHLFAAALLATGLVGATAAVAQTQTLVEVSDATMIPMINGTADALDDLDIYDGAGQKIGDIEEVLGTTADAATAVAVDFDDENVFGREDRVVPLDSLKLDGIKLVLALEPAAVANLPVYDD